MSTFTHTPPPSELACEVCGRYPEPAKLRATLANILATLPIELSANALLLETHWPVAVQVVLLGIASTALVIWVAEPGVRRIFRSWLHAPALRRRRELAVAPALWRARATLSDSPGALEHLTHALARLGVNILAIQAQPVRSGVVDELVLSAPGGLTEADLLEALAEGGGEAPRAWPTTPLALIDGPTRALSLAAQVAEAPAELRYAAAELVGAQIVPAERALPDDWHAAGTVLRIPTPWDEPLVLIRPGVPFTPAEIARVSRLAELAEVAEGARRGLG
ncbi:amino acid-binding protein [Sinomonas sp. ASV486]|uniref:amino acid-binding protein n=1 Tax=Sinomonas sp. ASV486 TaxID=3051170 RepID=UPI0027DD32FA|nr:amino acid-binding protein [Sinomonas sp. ASV486]MDQ4491666.1 amino acid-binding protein [Sinomonas sp. ASV486]